MRVEASAAGVADLEAALASLQPIGPASTVGISTKVRLVGDSYDAGAADVAKPCHRPSSTVCSVPCLPQVRYVEGLMRWNAHQEMRKQKMGLSMVLQGPMAVHVHAKASDNKKEEQLRKAVVACEMELQIDPGKLAGPCAVGWALCCWLCVCFVLLRMCSGLPSTCACQCADQRWAPGQEEYDAGARHVALRVCIAEARKIQDRVFRIKMIKQGKAQESGNAATKMGRKISKLRRFV